MNDNFLKLVKAIVQSQGLKNLVPQDNIQRNAEHLLIELQKIIPEQELKEYEIFYPYVQRMVYYIFYREDIKDLIVKYIQKSRTNNT